MNYHIDLEPHEGEKPRSIYKDIIRGAIAVIVIIATLFLYGFYQLFLYRETPPNVSENNVEVSGELTTLTVPVKIIVITGDNRIASRRGGLSVSAIFENAKIIWSQAGIELTAEEIVEVEMTEEEAQIFLTQPRRIIPLIDEYDPTVLNAFLVRSYGGVNGIAFVGTNSFAVADLTTVVDFRAFAHEIGHLLNLGHVPRDRTSLMYQGANGIELSDEEIEAVRKSAERFLAK